MISRKSFYAKCMSDKLSGTKTKGLAGSRANFAQAANKCQREYCDEVALEDIFEYFESAKFVVDRMMNKDSLLTILREHCVCYPKSK